MYMWEKKVLLKKALTQIDNQKPQDDGCNSQAAKAGWRHPGHGLQEFRHFFGPDEIRYALQNKGQSKGAQEESQIKLHGKWLSVSGQNVQES